MTQNTVDTMPCNTKRSRAFGPNTWNNHTSDDIIYMREILSDAEEWYFQEEVGENGTPHLQFCMKYKNARTWDSIKKKLPKCHIEVAKNWKAVTKYCQKGETRSGVSESNIRKLKDPLEGRELRPFQQQILDMMETEPDDRKVYWFYDLNGNTGKTSLAKSLCIRYPNKVLYMGGKAADCKYGITSFLESGNDLKMVIFDYVRTSEGFVSYEAIESIKNGIFFNTKYESKMIVFDCPHVVIFSNFRPETEKLSADRWEIINLTEGDDIGVW